jgi:uncharacterized Zn finger protein
MSSIRCPYCGFEGEFKLLKTWKYSWWDVHFYECPKCGGRFRYQVDPTGKYKSYIIRVGIGRSQKMQKNNSNSCSYLIFT